MLIIGIDGGGSNTRARVSRMDSLASDVDVEAEGISGPSNLQLVAFPRVVAHLEEAVGLAFEKLGLVRSTADAACLALAGCGRAEDRARIRDWANEAKLAHQVRVVHDAEPMLASLEPPGVGVALISGTGSFAFGRNAANETARSGGWGPLLGDEGSGYAIALAALRAAVQAADGRGPETRLLAAILDHWKLSGPQQLVDKAYGAGRNGQHIAELAPLVFVLADEQDSMAAEIVTAAAGELAKMVAAVALRLDMGQTFPIAVGGGCLIHHPRLRNALSRQLRDRSIVAQMTEIPNAVAGAVKLARALATSGDPK